ncbi:MAG: HAMP domain-containing sensor histidine kinase [Myxococcota bacterium]|nr:HAMP domain-containing sensor histidine kinase [Myxococcota bacterium]
MFRAQAIGLAASLALLAGAKALAAAEDGPHAASDTQGRIVYMVLPEDRQESFWSNPPEFEATGDIAPGWFTPQATMLYLVRVYPRTVGEWELQDCILQLEPAYMHLVLRWVSPEIPAIGLSRGSDVSSDQLTGGLCNDFGPDIPYFEFTLDVRSGLSWRLRRPPPEELLLGPEAEATLIFFFGLAGIAVVFAFSLALFFGSVRILLQSFSTTLLLFILVNRYGGLEINILEAQTMLAYRVPGRLFIVFCAIYCACSVWELNSQRRLHTLAFITVGAGLCIALPMPWLRVVHGNPYILVGGLLLACGLLLNLYYLTVRRGEGLAQVVRFIRVLILVLLLAGVMQLTGRLEEISMLPLWGFGLVLETLITVVLGLREQRQFTDLTRSLEEASLRLTGQRVSLKDDLTRLHTSYGAIAEENEKLLTANSELKLAMAEVSSVATAIKRKQQRMHFAELLGFRLAGLGHDLMNPLGLARGIMELLPEETWEKNAQNSKLEFIEEIDRMTSLRTAVRIFGRPEIRSTSQAPDARLRVFEIARTVESSIELFRLSGTRCRIETKLDQSVLAQGSAGDLSRVVVELLSNAERATNHSDREAQIRIELMADSDRATLSIHDSGNGFGLDEFKRCTLGDFGLGPVQETEEFHLGLGLIMCLRLVTDLSGEISVLPVPSDLGGAVMRLSLPVVKLAGQS